jgi:hypothetical protein
MEFKLPIQYISHQELSDTLKQDLELVKTHGLEPLCHKIFKPETEEATHMASQWMNYTTTNETFLKESIQLYKQPCPLEPTKEFIEYWQQMKKNNEFKTSYHYIEMNALSNCNYSSTLLFVISLYFITSPAMFVLTPILMTLIPFILIKSKGLDISWANYYLYFKQVMSKHSVGNLIFNFSTADSKQKGYLISAVIFFLIQLYANVYNGYVFYRNMTHSKKVLLSTTEYLHNTLASMKRVKETMTPLSTYAPFVQVMTHHQSVLTLFYEKLEHLSYSPWNVGTIRALFYELYDNPELTQSLTYSIHYHGYLQNRNQLQKNIGKTMNPCTFGKQTKLHKSYYPTSKPVKNSYTVTNTIVTGPNASGKTTFIKSSMINVILSQQLGCGFYKSAVIQPYHTFVSYINIPDTSGRDSLFQAEARRCKEIIDQVDTKNRIMCIFDELFSGTNPLEATASAISLLNYLANYMNIDFLLTTHFTEVCEKLKTNPRICLKRMRTTENPMQYTYKIEKGISYVRGGVVILEQMGFPTPIVEKAICG